MSSDLVTIDIQNGIADVRLNREQKYNALSQDMFDAIGGVRWAKFLGKFKKPWFISAISWKIFACET